jgi:hypothetical protein
MRARSMMVALVAGCALGAPAAASADDVLYKVTATGEGSYALDVDLSANGDTETTKVNGTFSWETVFPQVLFRDGRFYGLMAPAQEPWIAGSITRHVELRSPSAPDRDIVVGCAGGQARDPHGAGGPSIRDTKFAGEIILEPFSGIEFADNKCDGMAPEPFGLFGDEHDPYGALDKDDVAFDHGFSLPREAVGNGRIISVVQPYGEQLLPVACPSYSQEPGERCTAKLTWLGHVQFDRIDGGAPAAPPAQPGAGAAGTPAPAPAAAPAAAPARPGAARGARITATAARAASVRRSGVRVRLAGAAKGTTTLVARIGTRRVGSAKVRVGAAGTATATIRLTAAGRRLARPGATVKVTGAGATATIRLR